MSLFLVSESEAWTRAVGAALGKMLAPDGVLLLRGDLGSGKTVLSQGVAAGLEIDSRQVQSPTFTLIREHQGPKQRLVHIDLYRLDRQEVGSLGLWEILAGPGIKVVEWAERVPFEVPDAVELTIRILEPPQRRQFEIKNVQEPEVLKQTLGTLSLERA